MKGIIFREFLNMVEEKFGYEVVDQIIDESKLPNNGAYTSVGTYPHSEMTMLVECLGRKTGHTVAQLLEMYGTHVFGIFSSVHNNLIAGYSSAFEFLSGVEGTIHVEVLKLYPEAELPTLVTHIDNGQQMVVVYKSSRKMAGFALGLIKGSLVHFAEKADIQVCPVKSDLSEVQFTITTSR